MNAVVERMQRAQQYLERAAHLEETGQPVLCQTYTRRAAELIEETRTAVAAHRGSRFETQLAMERGGRLLEISLKPHIAAFQDAVARTADAFAKNSAEIERFNRQIQGQPS